MPKHYPETPYTNLLNGTPNFISYTGSNDAFQGTLWVSQNIAGSPGAVVGTNTIAVGADNAPSSFEIKYLHVTANFGGPLFTGYRTAISGKINHNTASPALVTALLAGGQWTGVGVLALASGSVNLGGVGGSTAPANVNWLGSYAAGNSNVFMLAGATNLRLVNGHEIDVQVPTGASTRGKIGLLIAKTSGDAVQGAADDAAIAMGDQGGVTVPWAYGLSFSTTWAAWPFDATSTLVGAVPSQASVTYTANIGLDFSGITFNTAPIKLPGGLIVLTGSGAPGVAAPVGSLYLRTDGGSGSTLYVKETGTGTSGWTAK